MYRVMFVDDEYMILEGLKWIIPWQELGFEIVKTARSAQEALAFLETESIDVLLTDITMPEMSGIELIEQAKKKRHQFISLILSGYQEFDYVKKGMALQVQDYLLKPVNKQELLANIQRIKIELDQQKKSHARVRLYLENGLMRWLNDEISEGEYEELMQQFATIKPGDFTVLLVEAEMPFLETIKELFMKKGQLLFIESWMSTYHQLLLIYKGARQEAFLFIREIEAILAGQGQIFVGESVNEWETVYESYEKVKQLQAIETFYQEFLPNNQKEQMNRSAEDFTFLAFNQALMIGDMQTIQRELDAIFNQLSQQHATPEYVRYVVFLLFSDISRQYPTVLEENYEKIVEEIRASNNLNTLYALMQQVLAEVKNKPKIKKYSESVSQAVERIEQGYLEELNLKTVADELHLNPSYLGQIFKKETKRSFSQYLNQVRTKHAQKLLLYTDDTINEISEKVGFNNTNYFSKMFKKLNGITPKEFREQYQSNYAGVEE